MSLVIENGGIVEGANSYCSVDYARAYATLRGLTFPAHTTEGDAAAEVLLIRAMDYLESLRGRYLGNKVSSKQALQWPRSLVVVDGFDIGEDEIPEMLLKAQAQLAVEAQTQDLQKNSDGKEIIAESVSGAVSVTYATTGNSHPQPVFAAVMAMLAPLLQGGASSGTLGALKTVRL